MTIRQLAKSNLFGVDVKLHIFKSHGCRAYILDFEDKVNIGNCEHTLNSETLDKEIHFLDPKDNTLVIYYRGE